MSTEPGAVVVCLDTVQPEPVRWIWDGRIPSGKLSEIVGHPEQGKTRVAMRIAADISRGRPLPGDRRSQKPSDVLILSAEDDIADTLVPCLIASGADLSRVHVLQAIRGDDGDEVTALTDPLHVAEFGAAVSRLQPALVIIDPLSAFLPGLDSHRDTDVRSVLAQLADIAHRTGAAILVIRHLTKSSADRVIYRASGSVAFTAAARVQILCGTDPDDSSHHAMITTKNNLAPHAPAVGFRLALDGHAEWTGDSALTAVRALRPEADDEQRTAHDEAVAFLREELGGGPVSSTNLIAGARSQGIAERTLHRAKKALGVEAHRDGFGPGGTWTWSLPAADANAPGAFAELLEVGE